MSLTLFDRLEARGESDRVHGFMASCVGLYLCTVRSEEEIL